MLKLGDCLEQMKKLDSQSIDLIYLDPPFYTQKTHKLTGRKSAKEYSFDDSWSCLEDYLSFLRTRLFEMQRLLKKTGSLFFHCDKQASHHVRVLLDEVFGYSNFQSEIIWSYKRWSNSRKGLLNSHQTIYFYSNTDSFKFNRMFDAYSPTTNVDQIFQKRARDEAGKTIYKADQGEVELISTKQGVPLGDVWQIPYLNPKAKERVGYPTQKPVILLERIIELVTDPGDMVLDPFCGSGTTLVAAKLLDREFIGFDISVDAIELAETRLNNPIKSESNFMKLGADAYRNLNEDIRKHLIELGIQPVERNRGIDGFVSCKNGIVPVPVKFQENNQTLEEAIKLLTKATKRNNFRKSVLIAETKSKMEIRQAGNLVVYICNKSEYIDLVQEIFDP